MRGWLAELEIDVNSVLGPEGTGPGTTLLVCAGELGALLACAEAVLAWKAWEDVADSGMSLGEPVLGPLRERAFELRDQALAQLEGK